MSNFQKLFSADCNSTSTVLSWSGRICSRRGAGKVLFLIYTKKENLGRYLGLSGSLDSAIRYLLEADLRQLQKGRNPIDGDQAFVNRFDYQTMPQE